MTRLDPPDDDALHGTERPGPADLEANAAEERERLSADKKLERFLTDGPAPAHALGSKLLAIGGMVAVTRVVDRFTTRAPIPEAWWNEPHMVTWLIEVES